MTVQRRTVTVKITAEAVEITAEVSRVGDLIKQAKALYHETRPPRGLAAGFGSQLTHTTDDRNVGGTPVYHYGGPVEA